VIVPDRDRCSGPRMEDGIVNVVVIWRSWPLVVEESEILEYQVFAFGGSTDTGGEIPSRVRIKAVSLAQYPGIPSTI
jgi:hypothetical protein